MVAQNIVRRCGASTDYRRSRPRNPKEPHPREVLRSGPPGKKPTPIDELPTPTVAEFAVEWLDICRTERQSPITVAHKEIMLRRHLLPVVGELRLDEMKQRGGARAARGREAAYLALVDPPVGALPRGPPKIACS